MWSYSALIKGYVQGGDVARARKVLQQMQAAGVPGNAVSWDHLAVAVANRFSTLGYFGKTQAVPWLARHPSSTCHAWQLPPSRRLLETGSPAALGSQAMHCCVLCATDLCQLTCKGVLYDNAQPAPCVLLPCDKGLCSAGHLLNLAGWLCQERTDAGSPCGAVADAEAGPAAQFGDIQLLAARAGTG